MKKIIAHRKKLIKIHNSRKSCTGKLLAYAELINSMRFQIGNIPSNELMAMSILTKRAMGNL